MINRYIRSRKPIILFYIVFAVFFSVVFYAYDMDMEAVRYALLITFFIFILWLTYDCFRFSAKIKKLEEIKNNITFYSHTLPFSCEPTELLYQNIINNLYEILHDNTQKTAFAHNEQIEYYTMWLHQIKTPISALRLALQNDAEKSFLYKQELFNIERYVEMALHYAKLNDISGDLVIREYDLEDIVKQSMRKFAVLFSTSDLSVKIEEIRQKVTTDSKWLSFIIEQLISNAFKYTPKGGIHIYTQNEALVIEDSGIGIREEDIPRIFEKGYTGYNGRLDKRASGLGLYMAKRAADRLAVKIEITSELGKGTKAILRFPDRSGIDE